MNELLAWIEAHPGLAGYAQALGSVVALVVAIGLPIWQRRAVERAAELTLHRVLDRCYHALWSAQDLFADESRAEFNFPGPTAPATDIAKDLDRASGELDRVSLYELNPKCATLVQGLQRLILNAARHVDAYVEGAETALGFDLSQLEQHEDPIYRLMLDILDAMPSKDRQLTAMLQYELELMERARADQPVIHRVRATPEQNALFGVSKRKIKMPVGL